MLKRRTLRAVAGIAASFAGFAGMIIFLSANEIVSAEMAILMLVALVGLYFGFGILVGVYLLVVRLEEASSQSQSTSNPRESGRD